MASDLHSHTNFSDGILSPSKLIETAKNVGLKILAITDHDTVDGVASLGNLKQIEGIHIIPGVEITAQHPSQGQLHIVGLNIDITNQKLKDRLAEFAERRRIRVEKILDKLNANGYKISMQDIHDAVGYPKTIVRIHVAKALAHKNFFETSNKAYGAMLKRGQLAYVPLKHPPLSEVIDIIHQASGKAILAHPKLVRDDDLVEEVARQVDGIEVYYPRHSWMDEQHYLNLARKYNLKISGGSDFHGTKGDPKHPAELGAFTVEDQIAENWLE